ncbi:VOC family protein [Cutibacterium sp. V947]|uniref:VOC family protein n=1 Tax=Cutibacterium sp. V947 TaxID=3446480 RepID=UPI003EDF8F08
MTVQGFPAYHRRVISHDLHALGFDAPDLDVLVNSAAEAGAVGVEDVGGFDLLAAYTDPSGARLALMKQKDRDEIETMASLVAPTTHPADLVRFSSTVALVDIYSHANLASMLTGESVLKLPAANRKHLARFLANVDDPVEIPLCPEPGDDTPRFIEHLRVGAVANQMLRVFESEEEYGRSHEGSLGGTGDLQFAVGTLISPWLMEINAGRATRGEASAVAEMTMVCKRVEKRTNELTDVDWYRIVGDTSIPMTLAAPANLPRVPHEGSIISGQVVPVVSLGTWEGESFWG